MDETHDSVVAFVESLPSEIDSVALCGLYRSRGGASRVIEQQATELNGQGYEVTVIALESDMEPPAGVNLITPNPVQRYTLLSKIYWVLFPVLPWAVFTMLRLRRVDLVITHRYPFTVPSYLVSRVNDLKYVFWSHPPTDSTDEFSGLASHWYNLVHRFETQGWSVRHADYLCAVSEDSRDYLQTYVNRSIDVVRNSISKDRFTEVVPSQELREKYDIDPDDQIVLFVGRITERKNIHTLIDVFQSVASEVKDVTLVIVGDSSQPAYLERLQTKAGENIVFTGFVSDAELAGFYSMADVFATCSLEEGWGLPISEADLFDTPIVAFESHPAAQHAATVRLVEKGEYNQFENDISKLLRNRNEFKTPPKTEETK